MKRNKKEVIMAYTTPLGDILVFKINYVKIIFTTGYVDFWYTPLISSLASIFKYVGGVPVEIEI